MRRDPATIVAVEKAMNITCSECVFVALITQHQNAHALNYTVACGLHGVACFSTLSHKRHDFRKKKVIEAKMCLLIFSKMLSETFLILSRIQRYIIINVHRSSCKIHFIFSYFNETWFFSTDFRIILKYQISWKSIHWEPSYFPFGQRDRQTDRHNEANSGFSQFREKVPEILTMSPSSFP